MEVAVDELYAKLAGPWISNLLSALLVLGFFFVLFHYIRLFVHHPDIYRKAEMKKRFLLLGAVSIFVFYVDLTYFLDYEKVRQEDLVARMQQLTDGEFIRAKVTLMVMVIVDLITIGILTSIFATVSIEVVNDKDKPLHLDASLSKAILKLFLLTASFHIMTIAWWSLTGLFKGFQFQYFDILFHLLFFGLNVIGFFGWRRYLLNRGDNWLPIGYYLMLVLSVYITRIWWYLDRYVAPAGA